MPLDNKDSHLDELTLQRLVDSELSHEQVRQLLAEVEFGDDATKWKTIALAFTENQMFERAIGQDCLAQTAGGVSTFSELSSVERSKPEVVDHPNSWWAAALAASLLLAVAVAYQIGTSSPKVDKEQFVQSSSTVDSPVVEGPKSIESFDRTTLASYEPDHQLETKNIVSASMGKHNNSIPLYDIGRLNPEQLANLRGDDRAAREAMFSRVLPRSLSPELVQQLQQSGGMVDQNLEFISGRLDDGRSYLIPYRTIRFLPGQ